MVATAAQWVIVPDPNYVFDFWGPAGPPRRGRPPKSLAQRRQRSERLAWCLPRSCQPATPVSAGGTAATLGATCPKAAATTPWPDQPTRARLVVAIIGDRATVQHAPPWPTTVLVSAV